KTNHILKQIISKSDFFKIKFQKKETGKIRHKTLTYSKPSVLQRKYPKKNNMPAIGFKPLHSRNPLFFRRRSGCPDR
ncbi:hypothetical protein K4F10_002037, partial [Neisseria gonorrhoeae]